MNEIADDESGWAQPARRGVVMVLATAVLSVSVFVVTLGATPEHPRRGVVVALLGVLVVVRGVWVVRVWRAGDRGRPLSPRWLRLGDVVVASWGLATAIGHVVPPLSHAGSWSAGALVRTRRHRRRARRPGDRSRGRRHTPAPRSGCSA